MTTPTTSRKQDWRRRVKEGYRPASPGVGTITHAHENRDYAALLTALKLRTVYADGCWRWLGQIKPDGSAWAYLRAGSVRARRLVAEAYTGGPLSSVDKVWGTCSHTDCINPEHLEIRIYAK